MKKATTLSLLPITLFFFAVVLVTAVLNTACTSAPEADATVAMQVVDLEPTAVVPTPTEETAVLPTATAEPLPTDECLLCHINQDELIQTADPVEEVVSENEGEG